MNSNADIQKFYEEKISQLLETQSREIRDLKAENERLVNEVKALSEQVLELRKNSKCKDCPFEL
jgi:cell division protein FtsB